jgi:hypothetical protein
MVKVDLQGTSRSPEAILELVDALFAHPSFFDPDLTRESFAEGQEGSFVLSVLYLPTVESDAERFEVDEEAGQAPVVESLESMEGGE